MAKQRPSAEELTEMSQQIGMTFKKMANHYQVDRKTIKRWCLDVGITQVGAKQSQEEEYSIPDEKPVVIRVSPPLDIKEEANNAFPDPIKDLTLYAQDIRNNVVLPLPTDPIEDIAYYVQEIAQKLRNGIPLKEKEEALYCNLEDIVKFIMKSDIDKLHERVDKHYHSLLSVDQGRSYNIARRASS